MENLPKYTLSHNRTKDTWELKRDNSGQVLQTFKTKEDATKGGVLQKILGSAGGSVKIQKEDGTYQEERTFPRSKDPSASPG
jgi:hypothetical protein